MKDPARLEPRLSSALRWALVFVPVILALGFLSGRVAGSGPGNPWFDALAKPAIYPPPAAFGIVWSILYVMMGIALALIVARPAQTPVRGLAIAVFLAQLALNLAWTPLFFAAHRISSALLLIAALDVALLVTIVLFWRVRRAAALLLVPYLAWVLFATLLTSEVLRLNPEADGVTGTAPAARIEL
ncbi:MAG: TspO/MBR family protein [Novosphingobium sp.]